MKDLTITDKCGDTIELSTSLGELDIVVVEASRRSMVCLTPSQAKKLRKGIKRYLAEVGA